MNLKLGSFVLAATVALSVNGCWQKTEQTVEVEAEMVPVLDVYAGKNEEKNLKLLVQAYEKEKKIVKDILKDQMENAASLSVPLLVDMHTGKNWYEAK